MSAAGPDREVVLNPPLPSVHLGRGSRRILLSLAETVVPKEPEVANCHERLLDSVAGFFAYLPVMSRVLLPLGMWLLEYGTLFSFFSLRPFSRLPKGARSRYLASWQHSRLSLKRQMVKGIKSLLLMAYYDFPEVQKAIGFEPAPYIRRLAQERADAYARRGLPSVSEPHAPFAQLQELPDAADATKEAS